MQAKRIYGAGSQADAHGFDFVDPAQNAASGFTAGYYAWDPKPGLRFISLETVSEGGATVGSAQGNIDDPQFQWLRGELARASAARKIVVVFGHHAIRTMTSATPDEAAPSCTGRYASVEGPYYGTQDSHGHDRNPGCDLDPRGSSPTHLGGELASLLSAHRNVVAYLAGHSHSNRVVPCGSFCGARGNWWEINTTATNDWPQQHRLLEIMDNGDGTLSILGTPVDHGAQVGLPPGSAAGFNEDQLASLARVFAYNDPKQSKAAGGRPRDANVELIVSNPRAGRGRACALCPPAASAADGSTAPGSVACGGPTGRSIPRAASTARHPRWTASAWSAAATRASAIRPPRSRRTSAGRSAGAYAAVPCSP